jgi:hypothetical protein
MRGAARVVFVAAAAALPGCATPSFDYQASVSFDASAGPVRLNHRTIAPGARWSASYSSFADALRNPSIVEIGGQTITIGPDACARVCRDCDFDRAELAFVIADGALGVTGTCGDGDRVLDVD